VHLFFSYLLTEVTENEASRRARPGQRSASRAPAVAEPRAAKQTRRAAGPARARHALLLEPGPLTGVRCSFSSRTCFRPSAWNKSSYQAALQKQGLCKAKYLPALGKGRKLSPRGLELFIFYFIFWLKQAISEDNFWKFFFK